MSEEVVTVKIEPQDDYVTKPEEVYQNGVGEHVDDGAESSNTNVDKRNFTCLLCDLVFEGRDDLRRHLKVSHTSKHYFGMPSSSLHHGKISDSVLSGFSSYINYRYTCTVCGAKFKAFRSYLTHSMSHRGTGSLRSQFDDVRMATILSSGKQYLQDYIDSEDGFPASFTCDECKTVFSQRDSYAMHMMMRAMNETCVSAVTEQNKTETVDTDESGDKLSEKSSVSPRNMTASSDSNPGVSLKSLEDVTSKVDQDEYLKSVLDRVFVRDSSKYERSNHLSKGNDEFKPCTFCGSSFEDQDSLAMHVMSDHAEQIIPNRRKGSQVQIMKPEVHWTSPTTVLNMNLTCKICAQTFVSRDSLAMHVLAHTQESSIGSYTMRGLNLLKRSQTFEDYRQHKKVFKTVDALNTTNKTDTDIKVEKDQVSNELYCNICDIKFYAETELVWHNTNKHGNTDINSTESNSLSKQPKELKESTDDVRQCNRTRRNSFSFDETSRSRDLAPRRPLSAGNVTSNERARDGVIEQERATDLSQKSTRSCSITPNLNALSSHEQRIIYSVFGKDLRVNIPSQPDKGTIKTDEVKKEKQAKPQKTEYKVRPSTAKSPLNLSYEHAQPVNSSYSGYSNGDKDGRSVQPTLPKDAAMCKYCDILFLNKAIYYLHMGLHNVNNPWQCNVCGKVCVDAVDFAAHVIHM